MHGGSRKLAVYTISANLLLLAFLVLWGVLGKVPQKLTGEGILINGGGSIIVYAPVNGVVSDVSIYQDMSISKMETVARIETDDGSIIKVSSPEQGRVISVSTVENKPIKAGEEIARMLIHSDNADLLEAVCYLSISDAGKVVPGMEMEIYPKGINTDESGYIKALVSEAGSYPVTKSDLVGDIGSDAIAESFLKLSPIIEVRGVLLKNPNSSNSYRWSSPRGNSERISDGMLINASVITGYDSPFVLILPIFKNILFGDG